MVDLFPVIRLAQSILKRKFPSVDKPETGKKKLLRNIAKHYPLLHPLTATHNINSNP